MDYRTLLEEMKSKRKDAIHEITVNIKELQDQRRSIVAQFKSKGPMTIHELNVETGLGPKRLLQHMIAMRKSGEVFEVGEKDGEYIYALRRGG